MGEKKIELQFERPLTSNEAMAYVGFKRTKFWQLVESGEIRGRKSGQWRFEKAELDKYIKRTTK